MPHVLGRVRSPSARPRGVRNRRRRTAAASVVGLLALAACGDGGPLPAAAANESPTAASKAQAVTDQDRAVGRNV